jgi:toxin-antitoxin system PIN domain toxin
MIVPDVNLLVYAYDSSSRYHEAAAAWWKGCMTGREEVGLATVVLFGFVRICTHPGIFQNPLSVVEAARRVESWLERPQARILEPAPQHVAEVLSLLEKTGTAGNLTTVAQIAVLARQEKAILHSNDTDFLRFPDIRWHNPLTGKGHVT